VGTPAFPGIDSAISKFEGFGTPGAPTITNANNPGALQAGSFANANGATGALNGFAVFPDVATGTAAEDALVQSYANQGYTVDQMINAWAPATAPGNSPESTTNYVNSVANSLGASPSTPISSLAGVPSSPAPTPGGFSITNPSTWLGAAANAYLNPTGQGGAVSWSRVGAFILGLIMIAAGLYLFKPPAALSLSPGPIGRGVNRGARAAGRAAAAAI
jgi:hypothetical protein